MRILLFVFTLLIGFSSAFADEQRAQGSYDPTISPRNNFLYQQHREVQSAYVFGEEGSNNNLAYPSGYGLADEDEEFDTPPYIKRFGGKQRRDVSEDIAVLSPIERYYQMRTKEPLAQYGYDVFERYEPRSYLSRPVIGVHGDYVLGVGDKIVVTFLGERTDRDVYTVDQDGLVIIPEIEPIVAGGLSVKDFKESLNGALGVSYHDTKAFVSLERIKNINISIIGEVNRPGRYDISANANVFDVFALAKGIEKTGSLRRIKRIRNGESQIIDLYDSLIAGKAAPNLDLRDGDRIIVPSLGPTIALTGEISRPGIYELSDELLSEPKVSIEEAMDYAGGILTKGQNRIIRSSVHKDGTEKIARLPSMDSDILIGEGDVLRVERYVLTQRDGVSLKGAVRNEGLHSLDETPDLARLLGNKAMFNHDIYPFLGVVRRFDPKTLSQRLIAFSPKAVVEGAENHKLQSADEVILFPKDKLIESLYPKPKEAKEKEKKKGWFHAALSRNKGDMHRDDVDNDDDDLSEKALIDETLAGFIKEYAVSVKGAVLHAGIYPIAGKTSLEDVISYVGGIGIEGDPTRIEVTNLLSKQLEDGSLEPIGKAKRIWVNLDEVDAAQLYLNPKDTIRVHEAFTDLAAADNSVQITGEVLYPGYYDLARGESLLDLINRAGGLTEDAYPAGAIFSRETERRREAQEFKNQALEIERSIAAALEDEDVKRDQIAFLKSTVDKLQELKPTGRITVEADPSVLKSRPAQDILLESGDQIYIPKRAITVRVRGEVLSPAVLQFKDDKSARDYILEAGGYTANADKRRAYVIFPDGSAHPLGRSGVQIPPMSTIYVPRDAKPFDFIQTTRDFTQILTNLAITGIFIDDISDDD